MSGSFAALRAALREDVGLPMVMESATAIPDADGRQRLPTIGAGELCHQQRHQSQGDSPAEEEPNQKYEAQELKNLRRYARIGATGGRTHQES